MAPLNHSAYVRTCNNTYGTWHDSFVTAALRVVGTSSSSTSKCTQQ